MGAAGWREARLARLLERALERTGLLTARLRILLGAGAELPTGAAASAELERLQTEVEGLGWVIGRLGAGLGADAMGLRHHPQGLRLLLELVEDEVRVADALPDLAPGGHELNLLLGLLEAGGGVYEELPTGDGGGLLLAPSGPTAPPPGDRLVQLGLAVIRRDGAWALDVPADWLQDVPPNERP